MTLTPELKSRLSDLVTSRPVVLFMKGNRDQPQCGFSARLIEILDRLLPEYGTVVVLSDPEGREGLKAFSEWPTIPQLYVRGEFQGGCDIVTEMYQSGELHQVLGIERPAAAAPPAITVSEAAARYLGGATAGRPGALMLSVDASYRPSVFLGTPTGSEIPVVSGSLELLCDRDSAPRAEGARIELVADGAGAERLHVALPGDPAAAVVQMGPAELQALRVSGLEHRLIDVRTAAERGRAAIDGAELLDETLEGELVSLPRNTVLVFHCHTGRRSQRWAERFARLGFVNVHNLRGGIDAWSAEVDPAVPRY